MWEKGVEDFLTIEGVVIADKNVQDADFKGVK